jgi:hypothetical protein
VSHAAARKKKIKLNISKIDNNLFEIFWLTTAVDYNSGSSSLITKTELQHSQQTNYSHN